MDIQPSKKVSLIEPSPTLALVTQAKKLAAEGKDVISLSVGEPDWPTINVAKKAGIKAIEDNFTNYTPARGIAPLREAIAKQTNSDFGTSYTTDNVTVATGGKYVIYSLLYSLINSGDEVLLPEPFWVSYPAIVNMCGGVVKPVKTTAANSFKMTAAELKKSITPKTKVLMLNSPSNPTGFIYSQNELNEIAKVIKDHPQLLVISDDIYNRLCFTHEIAPHLLFSKEDIFNQLFLVNGVSKSYAMTGWRIGWALGHKNIMSSMGRFQSQTTSSTCAISQKAAIAAIGESGAEIQSIRKLLEKRRDFAVSELNKIEMLHCEVPLGAFYLWVNIDKTFGKTYKGHSIKGSEEFSKYLLEDLHVVVVPGKPFNGEGYIRLSYAVNEEKMTEAINRIKTYINELS